MFQVSSSSPAAAAAARSVRPQVSHRAARMLLACAALSTVGISSADAVIVTFTNRTLWEAAALATLAGPIQVEGFESLPTGALLVGSNPLGLLNLQIDLLTVTNTGASIGSTSPITGVRELSINADEGMRRYTMTVTGAGFRAYAFDYTGAATGGIATLLAGGQSFRFGDINAGGGGFFGIVSTDLLPSVEYGDTSPGALPTEIYEQDNVSFVSIVPEPASGVLAVGAGADAAISAAPLIYSLE